MIVKPKAQKKKSKKLKILAVPKKPITKSSCRDEVIWELYQEFPKIKKDVKIKIYLQNVDFPVDIKYKADFLDDLKRKKVIEDYEIVIEERKFPPINFEETVEPNIDLLPLTSFEELRDAPRNYDTENYSESDYMAIIKCSPQKLKEYLKKDFTRVKQKKEEIEKRKKIEDSFKKEQVFVCDGLRFGIESGNAIYDSVPANFKPGGIEYMLLKALMENPDKLLNYKKICGILFGPKKWKMGQKNTSYKRDISFAIRNIKRKLKIIGKNSENEDLFFPGNGYRIACNPKE